MYTFRDFEKSLCILKDQVSINLFDPEHTDGANGILCYGYVDHTAGLTFEALSLVCCVGDDYTIILENDEIDMKIRANEEKMEHARPIRNDALLLRYAARIEIIDLYYRDTEVIEARKIKELDPVRHPQYPDDIFVVFVRQERDFERMWVRCEKILYTDEDGIQYFSGQLLNEPHGDFGFHIGKQVTFALFMDENDTVCIGSGNCPD